jgi:hypothetical protein
MGCPFPGTDEKMRKKADFTAPVAIRKNNFTPFHAKGASFLYVEEAKE